MDRTFAARARAGRRRPSRSAAPPGAPGGGRWSIRRPLALALSAIAARRRVRIAAICLTVAVPLLGGGWLWLRHSSLVAVEHIRISGVHGPQAHAIESALRDAARGMSTLDAKPSTLQAAVARFPAATAGGAIPRFPPSLRLYVIQRPAVSG